jgi:hypothetical protein
MSTWLVALFALRAPAAPPGDAGVGAFDDEAFGLFCTLLRVDGENHPRWKTIGCPATPPALPSLLRPRALVRRSAAYTSVTRSEIAFDARGRLSKVSSAFERGSLITSTTLQWTYAGPFTARGGVLEVYPGQLQILERASGAWLSAFVAWPDAGVITPSVGSIDECLRTIALGVKNNVVIIDLGP